MRGVGMGAENEDAPGARHGRRLQCHPSLQLAQRLGVVGAQLLRQCAAADLELAGVSQRLANGRRHGGRLVGGEERSRSEASPQLGQIAEDQRPATAHGFEGGPVHDLRIVAEGRHQVSALELLQEAWIGEPSGEVQVGRSRSLDAGPEALQRPGVADVQLREQPGGLDHGADRLVRVQAARDHYQRSGPGGRCLRRVGSDHVVGQQEGVRPPAPDLRLGLGRVQQDHPGAAQQRAVQRPGPCPLAGMEGSGVAVDHQRPPVDPAPPPGRQRREHGGRHHHHRRGVAPLQLPPGPDAVGQVAEWQEQRMPSQRSAGDEAGLAA